MGKLTIFGRNALIDHVYKAAYTPPATVYLALFTTATDETGAGTECTATNYSRHAITFAAASSRSLTQSADVTFDQVTTDDWPSTGYYGIMDAATGGNMLAYGSLSAAIDPVVGNTPKVVSGQCVISIGASSGAGFTDWAANKLLDLMFRNQAWSKPSTYFAIATATVADTDTSIAEEAGTGYSRTLVAASSFAAASSGANSNSSQIDLSTPTAGDWTLLTSIAVLDASTAGNLIAYDNTNVTDQTPASGDPIYISIGNFTQTLS